MALFSNLLNSFSSPFLFLFQIYFSFLAIEFEMADTLFMIGDKKSSQLAGILYFFFCLKYFHFYRTFSLVIGKARAELSHVPKIYRKADNKLIFPPPSLHKSWKKVQKWLSFTFIPAFLMCSDYSQLQAPPSVLKLTPSALSVYWCAFTLS